jgi:hypothetical protein
MAQQLQQHMSDRLAALYHYYTSGRHQLLQDQQL